MTIPQALIGFGSALALASVLGIIVRCSQENYKPIMIFISLFCLWTGALFDLIIPFVVAVRVIVNHEVPKKRSLVSRLFISLYCIPYGYLYLLINYPKLLNIVFWPVMDQVHRHLVILDKKKKANLLVQTKDRYQSNSGMKGMFKQINTRSSDIENQVFISLRMSAA